MNELAIWTVDEPRPSSELDVPTLLNLIVEFLLFLLVVGTPGNQRFGCRDRHEARQKFIRKTPFRDVNCKRGHDDFF